MLGFYLILLIGLIASGISMGIITMMPDEASKSCFLGYYAHCSFTPFSTLILFTLAIIGLILLIRLINHYKGRIPRKN